MKSLNKFQKVKLSNQKITQITGGFDYELSRFFGGIMSTQSSSFTDPVTGIEYGTVRPNQSTSNATH